MADPDKTPPAPSTSGAGEPSIKQLKAQLAKSQAEAAAVKAELAKAASAKKVPLAKIQGSLKVKLETPEGEKAVTISFVDGSTRVRIKGGKLVSSELLMALANGKELTPANIAENPALESVDKAEAVGILSHYAAIGVAFLKVK